MRIFGGVSSSVFFSDMKALNVHGMHVRWLDDNFLERKKLKKKKSLQILRIEKEESKII